MQHGLVLLLLLFQGAESDGHHRLRADGDFGLLGPHPEGKTSRLPPPRSLPAGVWGPGEEEPDFPAPPPLPWSPALVPVTGKEPPLSSG